VSGCCENENELVGCIKRQGILSLAEKLLGSEEEIS
jgi:hypothetical protein